MAVSTPGIQHITGDPSAGFYESLNTRWHKAALWGFTAIVLFHWLEHIVPNVRFRAKRTAVERVPVATDG